MGDGRDENPVIGFTSDLIINRGRDQQALDSIQYIIYLLELLGVQDLAISQADLKQFVRAIGRVPVISVVQS